MYAAKMTGNFMLFGVADGSQRVVRLEQHLSQCGARKRESGIRKDAPLRMPGVTSLSSAKEREARSVEPRDAIRQLVLDRLKFTNDMSELPSHFGVLQG